MAYLVTRLVLVSALWFLVLTSLPSSTPTTVSAKGAYNAPQPAQPDIFESYSPEVRQLLLTTFLGHAGQLPDPDEDVRVLKAFLALDLHRRSEQFAKNPRELDRQVSEWTKLTNTYPDSRHALVGLASLQRLKADLSGDPRDRRLAAESYVRAANIALTHGAVRYTRELAVLLGDLQDRTGLDQAFSPILAVARELSTKDQYIALLDYADGLGRAGDSRASQYFEQAITINPSNNVEAINKYARLLLGKGDAAAALRVLDRLTPLQRVMHGLPAGLRRQALEQLGMDTTSADHELAQVARTGVPMVGGVRTSDVKQGDIQPQFVHNYPTDDCRSSQYNAQLWCSSMSGWCYWPYTMNLGEILYNEARGESVGAQAVVAWTVRNRAGQGVSCDVYVGGVNYTTCRDNLPCAFPPPYDAECPLARAYCCVEHGGTMTPGASQLQFNDAHVNLADLEDSGTVFRAFYVINGVMSDMSSSYTPPGVGSCINTCDSLYCAAGQNSYSVGPAGPMEYRAFAYTAAGAGVCKYPTGFVCGNGGTNNYFWNRSN